MDSQGQRHGTEAAPRKWATPLGFGPTGRQNPAQGGKPKADALGKQAESSRGLKGRESPGMERAERSTTANDPLDATANCWRKPLD
jgi:hypothetical protein